MVTGWCHYGCCPNFMHDFPVWAGLGRCQQLARVIVIHYGRTTLDNSGQLGSSPATTWTWLLSADTHCMEETREADQSLQKCNTLTVTEFSWSTLMLCLIFLWGCAVISSLVYGSATWKKLRWQWVNFYFVQPSSEVINSNLLCSTCSTAAHQKSTELQEI